MSGTRSEYGLLCPLMRLVKSDQTLILQLIATGTHFASSHGSTIDFITRDGFEVDENVPIDLSEDSPVSIAHAMADCLKGLATALSRLRPDIMVVLGDRYEVLAAAQAAMILRIPIAHIHGGEATEALIDESIRHSVSKMSHIHFPVAAPYRDRIIQLGEDPKRVHKVGALCLDTFDEKTLLSREMLSKQIGFDLGAKYFVVTYHPVTLDIGDEIVPVNQMLCALDHFSDFKILITGVNADPGNGSIGETLAAYAKKNETRVHLELSLGQYNYLSALSSAAAVIGNSSSGLIEAPALKTPTVNIGERQRGRVRASSVVDCGEKKDEIVAAISIAISCEFRGQLNVMNYPFGTPGAALKIKEVLKNVELDSILKKRFHNIKFAQ